MVWSDFFVSLIKPMSEANRFGGMSPELRMVVSTGIMCIAYWSIVGPAFHETRNAVRSLEQSQIEALTKIMHDARLNDKDLVEDGKHRLLVPDLLQRLEKLVAPPKPVFGPEFVQTVKKGIIAHY